MECQQEVWIGNFPVTEFKYMGSTLQSNGDMTIWVNKSTRCGWNNWRKISVSHATWGYHHVMLMERFTRGLFNQLCCTRWRHCWWRAPTWRNWKGQRWRCVDGPTLRDRVRNDNIRERLKEENITERCRKMKLRWFGHAKRRYQETIGR